MHYQTMAINGPKSNKAEADRANAQLSLGKAQMKLASGMELAVSDNNPVTQRSNTEL
jgi:hypothetical protein